MKYGAKNDKTVLSTLAFNQAVKACYDNGGGRVVVPAGTYKTGTITLLDNVELHLEHGATIFASTSREDYPLMPKCKYPSLYNVDGTRALIFAEGRSHIALTGTGTIDGQGATWKAGPRRGTFDERPRVILFVSCKNIRVEGIRLLNSPMWMQHYLDCEDVIINKIEVYNHGNFNNDVIDIDGCRRFVLSNSIVDSDDDGITLKSTGKAACENITITNCVISSHCNAIKAGTESTGGFKNITISNCVIKPSRNKKKPVFHNLPSGITGISLEIVDGGTMEGVTISNVIIDGTECPLYIRLGNRARKHIKDAPIPPVGTMKNISISNLVAYNTGNYSNSITAIPGSYIENVMLSNVQFFNRGGLKPGDYIETMDKVKEDEKGYPQPTAWKNLPSSAMFIRHAKNIMIQGLMIGSNAPDPRVPIIANDVEGLSIVNTMVSKNNNTAETYFLGKDVSKLHVEYPLGWDKKKAIIE